MFDAGFFFKFFFFPLKAIAELAAAGINLWVLTGDKEETAINIAVACNVVLPKQYMDQVIINKATAESKDAMRKIFSDEIKVMLFHFFLSFCYYLVF